MDFSKMTIEELDAYTNQLAEEARTADTTRLDEINADLDKIEARKKELKQAADIMKRAMAAVANGAGTPVGTPTPEKGSKGLKEVRNSDRYVEAFAKYIKTGKDDECRAILTEDVAEPPDGSSGPVPVPTFVDERIKSAWERDEIFNRITKTYVDGDMEVGFEISATDAAIHTEGADAPSEEKIVLGIAKILPDYIKKWIRVSDKVMAMGPRRFLEYLYDEITYKVIKKAAETAIDKVTTAPQTSTSSKVGVPQIANDADSTAVINAKGLLGDDADQIVAVMNRATEAAIKAGAIAGNYPVDPFDGATVLHCSKLPAYSEAEDGDVYMVVGDLRAIQANLPEGESLKFVFDEYTYAEADLVKIVGKLLAGIEVTAPGMLVNVVKGEVESE